jgi:hypothetical protein
VFAAAPKYRGAARVRIGTLLIFPVGAGEASVGDTKMKPTESASFAKWRDDLKTIMKQAQPQPESEQQLAKGKKNAEVLKRIHLMIALQ